MENVYCRNYNNIGLPHFKPSEILKGNLRSTTKRHMLMLSFGKFYTRLEEVSHLYKGCTILRGGEEYTSKVCGCCLRIHEYLGTKKIFICPYGDCESHLLFGEDGVHRDESAAWKINMKMKLEYIFPPGDDKYNQWKYKKQVTLDEAKGIWSSIYPNTFPSAGE